MKKQEAIEKLREFCKLRAFCELYPDACQKDDCEIYMAIEALNKQIPMSVRTTTSTKRCGNCGRQLSGIGNLHPERRYCVKCGQAIDWSES